MITTLFSDPEWISPFRSHPLSAPRLAWPEFSPRIIPAWRETRGEDKLIPYFARGKTIPWLKPQKFKIFSARDPPVLARISHKRVSTVGC